MGIKDFEISQKSMSVPTWSPFLSMISGDAGDEKAADRRQQVLGEVRGAAVLGCWGVSLSGLGRRPGFREEMRSPLGQESCLKVKELRFRWLPCGGTIQGMFIEHLLGSSHCDMFQRDLNRCGPSPERAQGIVGQRAKAQGTVNHVTCQGTAASSSPSTEPGDWRGARWTGTPAPGSPHHQGSGLAVVLQLGAGSQGQWLGLGLRCVMSQ